MDNVISLSRLTITGSATLSTPLVVLKEIADAHLIKYDEKKLNEPRYLAYFVNTINSHEVKSIRAPYDMREYEIIARFVNNDVGWKKTPLMQSFNLLMSYTQLDNLRKPHTIFQYGRQTPSQPDLLNACVLFGICRVNRIDTRIDTTIEEMAANIKLLFCLKQPSISHSIRTAIMEELMYGNLGNYQLVNMLNQIDPGRSQRIDLQSEDETFVVREININHVDLTNSAVYVRTRGIRTRPRTHTEAVVMAAIHYKLDISKVKNPLAEYQELVRNPYIPLDKEFAKRLKIANEHPESLSNPRLDIMFNPDFPQELYAEDDLISMCIDEGYQIEDTRNENPYTILQTAWFFPTFFHGKQNVEIVNKYTTLADEFSELEYDNVVLYGVRGDPLRAYSYGELAATFSQRRRFWRPDGNDLFSPESINKLYQLCQHDRRMNESENSFNERKELEQDIDKLRLFLDANHQNTRIFIEKYDTLSDNQKEKVNKFMTLLMNCGMYMRGWSGEGDYPLSDENTKYPTEDEQGFVDIRVSESLRDIDLVTEDLREIGILQEARKLPLMSYRKDEFYHSTDEQEGLTIFDRLNIVKGGDDGSIRSCIRMSSNRLVASAYFYMSLMKMPLSFDINHLAHIV